MIKNYRIYTFILIALINLTASFAYGMEEDGFNEPKAEQRAQEKPPKVNLEISSLQNICLEILRKKGLGLKKIDETEWKKWVNDLPQHVSQLLKPKDSAQASDFVRHLIESDKDSIDMQHEFQEFVLFNVGFQLHAIREILDYFIDDCLTISDEHPIIILLNSIVSNASDLHFILYLRSLFTHALESQCIKLKELAMQGLMAEESAQNHALKLHQVLFNWFEVCEKNYNKIDNSLKETERQKKVIIEETMQKKVEALINYFDNDTELFKEQFQNLTKEEQQSILIYIFTVFIPYKKEFTKEYIRCNYFDNVLKVLKIMQQDLSQIFIHCLNIYPSLGYIIHGPEPLLMPLMKELNGRMVPAPILNPKLYFMYKLRKYIFGPSHDLCLNLFASNELATITKIIIGFYYKVGDCRLIKYFITNLFSFMCYTKEIDKDLMIKFVECIKILKNQAVFQEIFFMDLKSDLIGYIGRISPAHKQEFKQIIEKEL